MPFNARELSVLAYANGFTLWHYRTEDKLTNLGSDYFVSAQEMLRSGDMILVNCVEGGALLAIDDETGGFSVLKDGGK